MFKTIMPTQPQASLQQTVKVKVHQRLLETLNFVEARRMSMEQLQARMLRDALTPCSTNRAAP